MLGKNRRKKVRKNFFYIHTNIVTKKWGGKMRETIFPETLEWFEQKCWEKNRRKNVRKNFFYIHSNIVTKKWWGKRRETTFPETHEWFE